MSGSPWDANLKMEGQLSIIPGTSSLTISSTKEIRTSNLLAPNMLLSGHSGPVYSISFSPHGEHIASAGFDGEILLWDVFGECKNYNCLKGHHNAITEVVWCSRQHIVSSSADKTVAMWDANKGQKVRRFVDHSNIVNCVAAPTSESNHHLLASGGDDCCAMLWDSRAKNAVGIVEQDYQILSVAMASGGEWLFTGGIDNVVRRYDTRNLSDPVEDMALVGHTDSVTGLSVSPDGHRLLSTAMDSTLFCWDTRPFVASVTGSHQSGSSGAPGKARREKQFQGVVHNSNEKNLLRCGWSPDQERVTCGCADRIVRIWDFTTSQLLYYLPGHKGSVNQVIFHPTQPIIASCGTDRQIFLGELS